MIQRYCYFREKTCAKNNDDEDGFGEEKGEENNEKGRHSAHSLRLAGRRKEDGQTGARNMGEWGISLWEGES